MRWLSLCGLLAAGAVALPVNGSNAQIPYYNNYYSFGDSHSDTARVLRETGFNPQTAAPDILASGLYKGGRASNGPNFVEVLPSLIGLPHRPENGFAVAAAQSVHQPPHPILSPLFAWGLPDQINDFAARVGRVPANTLISLWSGYNDISILTPPGATPAQINNAAMTILGHTTAAVTTIAGLGAREFVVLNQHLYRDFERPDRSGIAAAQALNASLPRGLAPLAASGLNIRLFDVASLVERMRANPVAFGFNPDGATPCAASAACRASPEALEDRHISVEGVHLTGATNVWIARFLANQINAPLVLAAQADAPEIAATSFAGSLFARLDAYRWRGAASARAPHGGKEPKEIAATAALRRVESPISLYLEANHVRGTRNDRYGATGFDYQADGGTIGAEYQFSPNFRMGIAFNYANPMLDLKRGSGHVDMDSYQLGGYGSVSDSNWFVDAVVTLGRNSYDLRRPGAMGDALAASPDGTTITAGIKAGYLFDVSNLRLGPIAALNYLRSRVNAYAETGDALLTQYVDAQSVDGLTGNAGVQLRFPFLIDDRIVSPYLNVTAEQDFGDDIRQVVTAQTYAPELPIRSVVSHRSNKTYGRIAGGIGLELDSRFAAMLNASSTFARQGGNDFNVSGGIKLSFSSY